MQMLVGQLIRSAWAAAVLAVLFASVARAQVRVPGQSYFGRSNYIEYIPGNLPLIVSAPHGGSLTPAEIPDRGYGTLTRDANTQELARNVQEAVQARTGHFPHLILCRLHRTKVDCNREIVEGAQGSAAAEQAWSEFQNFITEARTNIAAQYGLGFYIDLHGHGHTNQQLELGYLLSGNELGNSDAMLNQPGWPAQSSLRALAADVEVPFASLLRGSNSLGALFEGRGYLAVPSPRAPSPDGGSYFSGGFNTEEHGSLHGGQISAVQIECNMTGVRDTAINRASFAHAVAEVVDAYFVAHYGARLGAPVPPVISRVALDAGGANITICWNAVPGFSYQVQCNRDLNGAEWLQATNVSAWSNSAAATVSLPLDHAVFYRVLALP